MQKTLDQLLDIAEQKQKALEKRYTEMLKDFNNSGEDFSFGLARVSSVKRQNEKTLKALKEVKDLTKDW